MPPRRHHPSRGARRSGTPTPWPSSTPSSHELERGDVDLDRLAGQVRRAADARPLLPRSARRRPHRGHPHRRRPRRRARAAAPPAATDGVAGDPTGTDRPPRERGRAPEHPRRRRRGRGAGSREVLDAEIEPVGRRSTPTWSTRSRRSAASCSAGGKRLRPAFCHWAYVGAGGDPTHRRPPSTPAPPSSCSTPSP